MRRIRPLTALLLVGLGALAASLALATARGDSPPRSEQTPRLRPSAPASREAAAATGFTEVTAPTRLQGAPSSSATGVARAIGATSAARADNAPREQSGATGGAALVAELGCAGCHTGLPPTPTVPAPALDHAGLRYSTGYLFDYLKSPRRVRAHIGAARMPDFRFDERESLALALYLSTLRPDTARSRWPAWLRLPRPGPGAGDADRLMMGELGCTSCHSLAGQGAAVAPDLAEAGARLRPEWVARYLRHPEAWDPGTPMPSSFYDHSAVDGPRARVTDAEAKLRAVASRISELGAADRDRWAADLARARAANPEVDATAGRRIFVSQNCAGCHARGPDAGWPNAPDLRLERSRVRDQWLREFLREPRAVRPFGHYPGSGSRMPDFRLTAEEADSVAAYLMSLDAGAGSATPSSGATAVDAGRFFDPAPVSPHAIPAHAARRAEALLHDRLPCLGCHSLDGEGGRIGPDLSAVGLRLRPEWIRAIVTDPNHASPGTAMPPTPMPDATRELLISYLQSRAVPRSGTDLSLLDHPLHFPRGGSTVPGLYGRYCAACHGSDGAGDGYNARYLPTAPTAHSSPSVMRGRPDDALFDAIHAGGLVMGRSARMPAFGGTLAPDQIRALVGYLRELCDCRPPGWSTDGSPPSARSPS